jgi:hypothetical protein
MRVSNLTGGFASTSDKSHFEETVAAPLLSTEGAADISQP